MIVRGGLRGGKKISPWYKRRRPNVHVVVVQRNGHNGVGAESVARLVYDRREFPGSHDRQGPPPYARILEVHSRNPALSYLP